MKSATTIDLQPFESWLRLESISPGTIYRRVGFARQFFTTFGCWDVDPEDLVEWLDAYTGWTRRTYYSHLRSLYSWLIDSGAVDADPTGRLRPGRTPRCNPSPLTPDEVERALQAARRDVRTWILLGVLAGLRCHEIAKIRGSDVTEQSIRVLGKGGLLATVPTHPAIWELAQTYPRDGWWFPSPQTRRGGVPRDPVPIHRSGLGNEVRWLFRSVGIESGSIHRCRHTYGTNLLRGGANLRVVQELMRHASLSTTALYLGVNEDERQSAIRTLVGGGVR